MHGQDHKCNVTQPRPLLQVDGALLRQHVLTLQDLLEIGKHDLAGTEALKPVQVDHGELSTQLDMRQEWGSVLPQVWIDHSTYIRDLRDPGLHLDKGLTDMAGSERPVPGAVEEHSVGPVGIELRHHGIEG